MSSPSRTHLAMCQVGQGLCSSYQNSRHTDHHHQKQGQCADRRTTVRRQSTSVRVQMSDHNVCIVHRSCLPSLSAPLLPGGTSLHLFPCSNCAGEQLS